MMNIFERFLRVVGLKSSSPSMSVSVLGDRLPRDLGSIAELSRLTFREPVELEVPPGRFRLHGLTTQDVGHPDDYLELRAARQAAIKAEKDSPKEFYAVDHDVRPEK